jgi:hypothetical protein
MKFKKGFVTVVLLASMSAHGEPVPADAPTTDSARSNAVNLGEYQAISRVLNLYIEGGRQGKSAIMKPAFHPDAMIYGGPGDKTEGGPISTLFSYIDSHPAAPQLQAQVVKIEVQNQIAFARVESDNWNGARFSDMFLLVKDGAQWKILTKTFHAYDNT